MWSNLQKGFSDALERTGEALEKTGDAITRAASNPNRGHQRPRPPDLSMPRNLESMPAAEVGTNRPNMGRQSPASVGSADSMGSGGFSPADIRARAAAALARVQAKEDADHSNNPRNSGGFVPIQQPIAFQKFGENLGQNFAKGWSNVVEGAKKGVAAAQEAVEKEQIRLELMLADRNRPHYFSRDLSLPLDVPALKDAEVVYVTDRIISMSHPALPSSSDPQITGERKLAAVCHLLEKRHGSGNVMIWNLSEVTTYHEHAAGVLDRVGPVLAFSFPGSPAPPLGLWLQLLLSMEKWLQASKDNVAVVHCLTGKGRTSTVLAAFLCWMAEAGFEKTNMKSALEYIAQCKKMSVEVLTIPSQRRYAQYFTNMLEGIRPSQPPLVLKRIIMSEAPKFALGPPIRKKKDGDASSSGKDDGTDQVGENKDRMGCAPYLQIFQSGKLLHTVAATLNYQQEPEVLPFCQVADGSIAFHVEQVIQGDVLVRCRHLSHSTKQKISMFRAAFHTGYAPPNVLRFTKPQLDGACNDPRFPDDFFVDLILEPCTNEQVSEFYQKQKDELAQKEKEAAESDEKVEKDAVVSASTYDSMLHRDSRFWDVITEHLNSTESNEDTPKKSKIGPTVGKRRVFTSSPSKGKGDGDAQDKSGNDGPQAADPLQTFSIGGELDFLPEPQKPTPEKPKQPPKKDTLMEALMGALGDEVEIEEPSPVEEIVFEDPNDAQPQAPAQQPQATIVAIPPAATEAADASKPSATTPAAASSTEDSKPPAPEHQESNVTTESMKEMQNILQQQDSDIDMDALLADEGDDFNLDDYNVDDDDDELADLENFLKS